MGNEKKLDFNSLFKLYNVPERAKYICENCHIDSALVSKKERTINMILSFSDVIVKREDLAEVIEGIKKVYKLNKLTIDLKYTNGEFFNKDYFETVIDYCKMEVAGANGFLSGTSIERDGNNLNINLKHGGMAILKKIGCDKKIEILIHKEFSINCKVNFVGNTEILHNNSDKAAQVFKNIVTPQVRENVEEASRKDLVKPTIDNIILGKEIRDQITKLSSINAESGRVAVEGDVFAVATREVKDGRFVVLNLSITDQTSSLKVSRLFKKEDYVKFGEHIKEGMTLALRGDIEFNRFEKDISMKVFDINIRKKLEEADVCEEKRVELHLHSSMSQMDGMNSVSDYIKRAAKWGHKAVAITDHGVVQAFPEAMGAGKKNKIKVIYGVEGYYVNDSLPCVYGSDSRDLDDEFVVFDIETTGLKADCNGITEIGAVKVKNGEIIGEFSTFVDPEMSVPYKITELTGITNEMLIGAPKVGDVLRDFYAFCGNTPLIAHNANFDVGFLKVHSKRNNLEFNLPYCDTVLMARFLLPNIKKHKLDSVAKALELQPFNHHRAVDDCMVLSQIWFKFVKMLKEDHKTTKFSQINALLNKDYDFKKPRAEHMVILVKNAVGMKNLYKLVSIAHLNYFYRKPRILKSQLLAHREGLIIGSACDAGELYNAVLMGKPQEEIESIAKFYDYLEVQPTANSHHIIEKGFVKSNDDLRNINKKIVVLGEKLNIPVVATGDVHFLNKTDEVFRRVLMAGQGFSDADNQAPLYFRTTQDMLSEFAYLGKDKAFEVVVTNTNLIADMCEEVKPISDEKCPPEMENAKEDLERLSREKAHKIYGEKLPQIVEERMDKELKSIIGNGFAVMYMIAQKLVQKSISDGYLVGSRGSVGSSFVAFLSGITEVNSLQPHYICGECKYSDFNIPSKYKTGADMEDKECPICGKMLMKDGFDIPFETFLGFDGDKEPDIDLNFSGEYQAKAHYYTGEIFGHENIFKAGTIGTIAEKTAYGYVKKYLDERERVVPKAEEDRLTKGCTGVKRTTGQHPGGIIVVPKHKEIFDFCPIQRPADDGESDIITTHFDYHSIDRNLLKLDILGHDDPTVIRMLEDLIEGMDARTIPLDDKETMSIFTSTKALGIEPDDITSTVGSLAIPEFGTRFVRQMLEETKPTTFIELVNISGLSHGTDVWINNAQDLVKAGVANLSQVICTRDDIMIYLISKGVPSKIAFTIMESVRKGKGLTEEWEKIMKENNVPDWYIKSCKTIKYMFPKAHAVAYVTMAFRIAYCKVHHPLEFYCAYFSIRADDFDAEFMINGVDRVRAKIKEIESNLMATNKEKNMVMILEVCYEFYKRGFKFCPIDLYKSHEVNFLITEDGILPPLSSLAGLGVNAAKGIVEERKNGEFDTVEDLRIRCKLSKSIIEIMERNGVLNGMHKTSQISLF